MIRLEDDQLGVLVLDGPYRVQSWEDSGPEVREVVYDRPGADGVVDDTAHTGARVVTMAVRVVGSASETRAEARHRLAPFLHPKRRVRLVRDDLECGNAAERQITVRRRLAPETISEPGYLDGPVTFVSVESYWRSLATRSVSVEPGAAVEPGFTFPVSFPLSFGGSSTAGSGRVDATSDGSAPASLVTRIYGPCVGPSIRNLSTGGRLDFDLTVNDGHWLEVDSATKTVRADGSPGANRLHTLDFPTRVWFGLEPGVNELRFVVDSSGAGCRAEFTWQDHYL